jgi:TolB protein
MTNACSAALLVLIASCNSLVQLAPDPLGDLTRIQITPKSADLLISDLSQPPIEQTFHAIGVFSDGARRDITQQLLWNVDNGVPGGFLTPGVFTTTNAASGHIQVIAQADAVWATADVTVRIDTTIIDGAFPPSDPDLFETTKPAMTGDPTRSPASLYPSTKTIFAQTLPGTVFQLARGALNDAFRLTFDTDLMHVVVLTGADRWETGALQSVIAQSNTGQQMTVSIDAASSADPGTIYRGSPIEFSFAKDAPDGPLYYWSAATSGIMRAAIGASSAGKLYPSDGTCVGCHTVSRDGTRMAMGYGNAGVSALQTIDVPTLTSTISQAKLYEMGWATYSPDGALVLIANDGVPLKPSCPASLVVASTSPTALVPLRSWFHFEMFATPAPLAIELMNSSVT